VSADESRAVRLPLLKTLKDLAKSGAKLDASIVTTFAFSGLFYEEVLLRAFERAGSRLNIVLVDERQLTESISDPLRRPTRAGRDYVLAPISHTGAFHPKIIALLSEKHPVFAIGSHNATDAGFSHNEEVTAFWGTGGSPPTGVLRSAVEYALSWLSSADAVPSALENEITGRIRSMLPTTKTAGGDEASFIASRADVRLWRQMLANVSGVAQRVFVVGPYFDADLSFLKAIDSSLGPSEIIVGIQPETAILPRPELAPKNVRFVDASGLGAFWSKSDEIGFAHGKAIAIETTHGLVVSFGSANPTGAAWLEKEVWNAEANLCLQGASADTAFAALGLNRLVECPSLESLALAGIGERSRELRDNEHAAPKVVCAPILLGKIVNDGVFLSGFSGNYSAQMSLLDSNGDHHRAVLGEVEGGHFLKLDVLFSGGLYELQSEDTTIGFVLLHDEQALRKATLPRDSARILQHLGSLDSGTGFTELLDLIDRHILSSAESSPVGASRATNREAPTSGGADPEAPFGPRGVSIPLTAEAASRRPRLNDGLIADLISALIRALGATPVPATDGDAPDLDEGDAGDKPTSDEIARNSEETDTILPEIDWPRLVTACRKRLTVMIRRLEARLGEAAASDREPAWALGRLVIVLSLLQRLRAHPPQSREAISGRIRPTSLVSLDQLRATFGIAVRTLYGSGKLAMKLETAADTRAAEERRLLDNLLLWYAREIGADYQRQPGEKLDPAGLQSRADVGPVAMSAAADRQLEPWAEFRDPWLSVWDDALTMSPDWTPRQISYGSFLQKRRGVQIPKSTSAPKVGDLVHWAGERDLPWVVGSISGHKAGLIEPAGVRGTEKKVFLSSVVLLTVGAQGAVEDRLGAQVA